MFFAEGVDVPAKRKQCQYCGASLPLKEQRCTHCGAALDDLRSQTFWGFAGVAAFLFFCLTLYLFSRYVAH